MESRASLRQGLFSTIYLPIVYVVFGTILGECLVPFSDGTEYGNVIELTRGKWMLNVTHLLPLLLPLRHNIPFHGLCSADNVGDMPAELFQLSVYEFHRHEPSYRAPEALPPRALGWHCLCTRAYSPGTTFKGFTSSNSKVTMQGSFVRLNMTQRF